MASEEAVYGGFEMTAEQYIDASIGPISLQTAEVPNKRLSWHTLRQLNKWTANKEGSSNFDPKLPATFQQICSSMTVTGSVAIIGPFGTTPITDNDNLTFRMSQIQIAEWTLVSSKVVLTTYKQSKA